MKISSCIALSCLLCAAAPSPVAAEVKLVPVFEENFESGKLPENWQVTGDVTFAPGEGKDGSSALRFRNRETGNALLFIPLNRLVPEGTRLALAGSLRVTGDIRKKESYRGAKLQFEITDENGQTLFPNGARNYDKAGGWRDSGAISTMPRFAGKSQLKIGLELCEGELLLDNLRLFLIEEDAPPAAATPPLPPQKRPRYRGMMSGNRMGDQDLDELAAWGANLIRYQLKLQYPATGDLRENYLAALNAALPELDRVLDSAAKRNMKVVIDLHRGPYRSGNCNFIFGEPEPDGILFDAWTRIANRCKGHPAIYAYDLLNEPAELYPLPRLRENKSYHNLAQGLVDRIRAIDPETPIVIECPETGNPLGFETMLPVKGENLIYSVHFYYPNAFTGQGLDGGKNRIAYPGKINSVAWNRGQMRKALRPVIDFQKKYRVPIFVGEFSAAAWAPGAAEYLKDCTGLFEELGWDWTYHAFREYDGWSVEHEGTYGNLKPAESDTLRKKVLLDAFRKNHGEIK